jgi:hypothetical protein
MTSWAPNSSPHLLALIDKTHAPFENSILDYRMFSSPLQQASHIMSVSMLQVCAQKTSLSWPMTGNSWTNGGDWWEQFYQNKGRRTRPTQELWPSPHATTAWSSMLQTWTKSSSPPVNTYFPSGLSHTPLVSPITTRHNIKHTHKIYNSHNNWEISTLVIKKARKRFETFPRSQRKTSR